MSEQLRVGDVLDTSFRLFRENLKLMFGLTGIAAVAAALLQIPSSLPGLTGNLDIRASWLFVIAGLATILAIVLLTGVVEGAITWAVFAGLRGQKETPGECYRKAFAVFWPLIGTTLAVGFLTGAGFLLCLVPGFIAVATLSVAIPAVMIEGRQRVGPITRSLQLTTGYRGKVLLTVLVSGIIVLIISFGLQVIAATALGLGSFSMFVPQAEPTFSSALLSIVTQFLSIFLIPLSAIPCVVLFANLRDLKEGTELENRIDHLVGTAGSQGM